MAVLIGILAAAASLPIPIALCALYSGASRLTPKIEVFMDYLEPFIGTERDPYLRGAPAKVCFIKP
jgi:hypothetical protein